ncbi:hypothetical protein ACH42_10615 [Endozoicomonas sp. (ex Bugula neritina AB1)]|nr:hypothetical protein ACH42_10615 [Endozoicomonas sp. (ex Bugula neritina AB1)]
MLNILTSLKNEERLDEAEKHSKKVLNILQTIQYHGRDALVQNRNDESVDFISTLKNGGSA